MYAGCSCTLDPVTALTRHPWLAQLRLEVEDASLLNLLAKLTSHDVKHVPRQAADINRRLKLDSQDRPVAGLRIGPFPEAENLEGDS